MSNILNAIKEVVTSQAQALINLGNNIGNFFSDLGTNMGNLFDKVINSIKDSVVSQAQSLINLGNTIGGFFNNLSTNILDFFKDLPGNLKNILDSFVDLLQYINPWSDKFFLKIAFVMTEEQEQIHANKQDEFNNVFRSKIPLVGELIDTFQGVVNRQNNVMSVKTFSDNPLNLEIGSIDYDGGVVSYNTEATDLSFVLEKYEPYRLTVRNGLMFIVYGIGVVYLVRYVLNYGVTQGGNLFVSEYKSGSKED